VPGNKLNQPVLAPYPSSIISLSKKSKHINRANQLKTHTI